MAIILFVHNTDEINKIFLESNEICPIDNCDYTKDCYGKKSGRDNNFICNLKELISLYEKNRLKKSIK